MINAKSKKLRGIITMASIAFMTLVGCGDFIERTYTLDDYTITYDAQEGTMPDGDEAKAALGAAVILPEPERRGYEFLGWYSEPGSGGRLYGKAGENYEMGAGDVTMYARWESILKMDVGDKMINGIVCVWVAPGTFTMGSPQRDPDHVYDEVQRTVTLTTGFWISKYPITNRQYRYDMPYPENLAGFEEYPAVNVDWNDAMSYAESAGGTLPTEAQWEFAARGGNIGKNSGYSYSGGNDPNIVAWYADNSAGSARKVGLKQPNQLRIYDMSGNVSEWCLDAYGYHDDKPVTDPVVMYDGTTTGRVIRGGGWNSPASAVRVADRAYAEPVSKNGYIGFRIVFAAE